MVELNRILNKAIKALSETLIIPLVNIITITFIKVSY